MEFLESAKKVVLEVGKLGPNNKDSNLSIQKKAISMSLQKKNKKYMNPTVSKIQTTGTVLGDEYIDTEKGRQVRFNSGEGKWGISLEEAILCAPPRGSG